MKLNKKRGFTLIELLVVISIIALLASISMVFLENAKKKGRDAIRFSDMNQILKALELYHLDNGNYPESSSALVNDACEIFEGGGSSWEYLSDYLPSNYITIPDDPNNNYYIPNKGCYWYVASTTRQSFILEFPPEALEWDDINKIFLGDYWGGDCNGITNEEYYSICVNQ